MRIIQDIMLYLQYIYQKVVKDLKQKSLSKPKNWCTATPCVSCAWEIRDAFSLLDLLNLLTTLSSRKHTTGLKVETFPGHSSVSDQQTEWQDNFVRNQGSPNGKYLLSGKCKCSEKSGN